MRNKEKNFVSIIIYVHNAENRILDFLKNLIATLEENFEYSEIICVNDASVDNSLEQIKQVGLLAQTVSVSVVNMSYYHGLEISMNAGMDLAIGDFVFEFDNTILNFKEEEILKVYKRALQGYDIVSASPNLKERLTSSYFYKVFECFTDIPYNMKTESFRVLSRRAINRISSMNKAIPYRKAAYENCGLKTDNIKYDVIEIRQGMKADKKEKNIELD